MQGCAIITLNRLGINPGIWFANPFFGGGGGVSAQQAKKILKKNGNKNKRLLGVISRALKQVARS